MFTVILLKISSLERSQDYSIGMKSCSTCGFYVFLFCVFYFYFWLYLSSFFNSESFYWDCSLMQWITREHAEWYSVPWYMSINWIVVFVSNQPKHDEASHWIIFVTYICFNVFTSVVFHDFSVMWEAIIWLEPYLTA